MMLMQQQQAPAEDRQHVEPPPTAAAAAQDVAQGGEKIYQDEDEFDGDMETWAADHDQRDIHQFEAEGQDYSHHLQADELHWENESFARSLPPGWAKCPNSGKMILDMLPIKVRCSTCSKQTNSVESPPVVCAKLPLCKMQAPYGGVKGQRVPTVYQWKPSDVCEHLTNEHKKRLGAVIDLTMSKKYYQPDEFERLGVTYIKIPCKGHGETPSPTEVNKFVWAVQCEKGRLKAYWDQVCCSAACSTLLSNSK